MNSFDTLSKILSENDIKPSIQRIKILEYLIENRVHPTADNVYLYLKQKMNFVSKATVYNTLALFAEKGMVRVLTFENNENRYDINVLDHGHFICETCGNVEDFQINLEDVKTPELDQYNIFQKDVYFKGICPKCL